MIVLWSVANEEPYMALEGGGVLAKSGMVYDQNGAAVGMMGASPTYSWLGNTYQVGSVRQLMDRFLNVAASFWPVAGGNVSANGVANKPLATYVSQRIAEVAAGHVGSQNWLDAPGQNKCNLFVHDVLVQAGAEAPLSTAWGRRLSYLIGHADSPYYPAVAGEWASSNTTLKCWKPVSFVGIPRLGPDPLPADLSKPGDIIAESINYSDATGHVGVVIGPQQTVSADSAAPCIPPFNPAGTIDISDYGFRLANWTDPYRNPAGQPCRTTGKKSNAVVKRFVCQ